jgi:beta-mannosidase
MLATIILLLVLCSGPEAVAELFDLSSLQWTLKNQNGSIQIPAKGPPSQAHLDLVNAGIITEPLLGVNGA